MLHVYLRVLETTISGTLYNGSVGLTKETILNVYAPISLQYQSNTDLTWALVISC